ncbi:MAG: IS630 family transposase [Phycisphaerae bacterium]|nr:IS630 family transposase [Phycisphaerae bacterium]
MRVAPSLTLSVSDRDTLASWSRGRSTQARLVQRARIILLAAEGRENIEIADEVGTDRQTVGRWRTRFAQEGIQGIKQDRPRGGRKPSKRQAVAEEIIHKTTQEKPKNATHWSTRTLASEMGINATLVHRVWKDAGLKPHLTRTFKLSNDPHFIEKLVDVVGLYLNPPEHALVLSADEKSQVQALDRTQPGLPLKRGRAGTLTHDYKRNGTTTLFAAMEMAEGKIISTCMARHRHQEWIKFLELIDGQTAPDLDLHVIADNYAAHKHPRVKSWLKRHPRFHMHFIPTSSSWLNLIERWFRELTDKQIRRGSFHSVRRLIDAIEAFVHAHNTDPKPFVWTAGVQEILEKLRRARATLDKMASA